MFKWLADIKSSLVKWCINAHDLPIKKIYDGSNPTDVFIPGPDGKDKFRGSGSSQYLVKTPTGWAPIKRTLLTVEYEKWYIELANGLKLTGADEHIVMTSDGECYIKDLQRGQLIHTSSGLSPVILIYNTQAKEHMYDLEIDSPEHVYYTNGILSHNTTVVAMYMLWVACFLDDKECKMASKAMNHAVEIMGRVKYAYEELPAWLKPGCKFYNRTSIEFDNSSRIKSEATSPNTGRGSSPYMLFLDEIAFIKKNIQESLWASIAPSLSTGGKVILTSTPNGDTDLFASLWRGAMAGMNSFKPVTSYWYEHPDRDQKYYDDMKGKLGPVVVRQELDCEFLSSDSLLISSLRLHQIKSRPPVYEDMGFQFWEQLSGDKQYLVGLDPATGNGNDNSAIEIFEYPSLKQVGEFKTNSLNLPLIYAKLKWVLRKLTTRDANGRRAQVYWSFERNGIGESIVTQIQNDEGDANTIWMDGAELVNPDIGKFGMFTSNKVKINAALQLKKLMEKVSGGFNINSEHLLFELKNYVSSGSSYAAKKGATDDCVSAVLIVIRIMTYLAGYDDSAREALYGEVAPDAPENAFENHVDDANLMQDAEPLPIMIL